jgi:hypothetical protein
MRKVLNQDGFLFERDLSERADEFIIIDLLSEYYSVNEGKALDSLKNVLSKGLLGPFSRITVIDTIRKGNLDAQKEIVKKEYDLEDELLKIKVKIESAKSSGDSGSQISMLQSQAERKRKEYSSFVKMKKEQMEKGMRLLEKTIGKKERRKEYYEAGFLDDKYELAKFEYDLAKKRSKKTDKLDKLSKDLEKAAKEVQGFTPTTPKEIKEIKVKELGDIASLKKRIADKDIETVKLLGSKTKKRIDEVKEEMIDILEKMKEFLMKSPTYEQIKKSGTIGLGLTDLTKKANELDSLENLEKIYKDLLSDKELAKKTLTKESSLTDLMSKISSAIIDGNDAKSGITQEIVGLSSDIDTTKLRNLIKKLS